jgi:hypothetical protein
MKSQIKIGNENFHLKISNDVYFKRNSKCQFIGVYCIEIYESDPTLSIMMFKKSVTSENLDKEIIKIEQELKEFVASLN